jgi:signal transduction histidine kinase
MQPWMGTAPAVLVVDDDPDHRFLMQRAIEDAGYRVETAARGSEALIRLEEFDIMLLDYRLPDMTGLDVLRVVVETEGPSVVMVTAMGSESVAVEAMRAGAIDYVVKGSGYLQQLPHVLERAFRSHDLGRRARLMQRMALLLTSSLERREVSREIVAGARQVLRADACALYVRGADGEVSVLTDGRVSVDMAVVEAEAEAMLTGRRIHPEAGPHGLLVPLPEHDDRGRLGVLAVLADEPRSYGADELRLAETFASFAGIALANATRLELERSLVTELQQTLDLRRTMIMSLSHELRTPLTCILGFSETILGHWDGLSDGDRQSSVATIAQHAHDLQGLVEQLLDFSALEKGGLDATIGPVDLDQEVADALQALAPLVGDREVRVDVEPVTARADPALFRRTLGNLLSNAVKYSAARAPIGVLVQREGAMARVTVEDAGVGLSPEEASHVFEPFWRGHQAVVGALRGSGIGLALVHEYVRVMGGETSVTSSPGAGSRFSFTLPVSG